MLTLSLSEQILFFLFFAVGLVCVGWVSASRRRKRQVSRRQLIVTCRICGVRYEVPDAINVRSCPACATPNEALADDSV